ncbi:hypothetical protein PB01_10680 [Psychrobacillus glaciei]|uniref:Uncharacterized protein n=1 Tax=Psychrobacillus glaciei TaxID=2283160 RepID=A0A5J6SSQ6_9BACI|nr:hypothetical protein [Psychrobacillus glaciei]QFF99257.1 hypothetical protein PB01_10680 [Psychrobacillus glaciei]
MKFAGFNKKTKGLIHISLLFLILGLISFNIVDSIKSEYSVVRDNLISQINGEQSKNYDIKKIENTLQAINERFHTSESIAIYSKKDGVDEVQYFNLDLKEAEYLFPLNAGMKENLITELFYPSEGFDVGKYYIVHRYFADWFYLFPVGLFTLSGVLFILWLLFQIKYIYTTRLSKHKLKYQ